MVVSVEGPPAESHKKTYPVGFGQSSVTVLLSSSAVLATSMGGGGKGNAGGEGKAGGGKKGRRAPKV